MGMSGSDFSLGAAIFYMYVSARATQDTGQTND